MQRDRDTFLKANTEIVVVTQHSADEMRDFWRTNKLAYRGVPDHDGELAKLYRQQWKASRLGRMPAQFLVGCDGKLAFVHYGTSMSDIPPNKQMLSIVNGLEGCPPDSEPAETNE